MQALIVVDAQNEFSDKGQRPVPNHAEAIKQIQMHVERARKEKRPIAWIRHYNRPHESPAFVPGSWGAELSPGLGEAAGFGPEKSFTKDVFGAFTGTAIEEWLRSLNVESLLIAGFYAHMCVSTSSREALMRGFDVAIDPLATSSCDLEDEVLGRQSADEVRCSALLHLKQMGVNILREEAVTNVIA
jgi:nicotinamidase-related amidase